MLISVNSALYAVHIHRYADKIEKKNMFISRNRLIVTFDQAACIRVNGICTVKSVNYTRMN